MHYSQVLWLITISFQIKQSNKSLILLTLPHHLNPLQPALTLPQPLLNLPHFLLLSSDDVVNRPQPMQLLVQRRRLRYFLAQ
jgi:hypothetical protein